MARPKGSAESKSGSSLSGLSVAQLEREIAKRRRKAGGLIKKRETLLKKLATLDAKIRDAMPSGGGRSVGVSAGRGGKGLRRTRPKNEMNLVEALAKLLKGKTMNVTGMSQAVQDEGYKTHSPNFRTIVNQTLINNPKIFKRVARGQYTAA
jgi:hypothetical protein